MSDANTSQREETGYFGRRQSPLLGIFLVMASAVTFSTAGLFTKGVTAGSWEVIFWRGVFAVGFTIGWICFRQRFRDEVVKMGWSGVAIAAVGAVGTAAFIASFKLTSIANVSLIYAVAPLISALLAWVWIKEPAGRRVVWGAFGALAGVAIIVSGSLGGVSLKGDLLALLMACMMALMMVLYRVYPETPGAGPMALSSVLLLPFCLMFGAPFVLPMSEIVILAAFGLIFAIASVTLAEGVRRIPAGQAALLSTLEVPLAPVLAFVVLAEIPAVQTLIGAPLVLIAVLLAAWPEPEV
ncbi:EamA-like transporter family protein [Roseovarius albus]|uniref:EamA-like transporter family protein n=1 Tax=Roseovarius albus TaxID=1247867 RepID=A0A1X6Y9W3_9RHOB|nr:DMT family transporter [Roseovarius albus]SLN14638.1 EamA-like transporter family protein [Roseovarius albus]